MEEKQAPESMATVTIKPEYPPSEYCSSEPPPAYHKPQSSAVQVAKIVAVTIVLVSFVLGSFLLASAYVTANASCRQLEQDLELLSEVADKFDGQNQGPLQPEALIQEEPTAKTGNKRQVDALKKEASKTKEIEDNNIDSSDSSSDDSSSESEEEPKVHFKLPLQLDFDDLAGTLIAKNQRSKMNCIVEKKRAEEVVDHQPKTLRLPFGVNLTTDPRFERLTGERMVIICESGHMQSAQPPQQEKAQSDEDDDDDDSDQETIMIQPVMIPIPPTNFQTHMPQQMAPMPVSMQSQAQSQPQIQIRPLHPMEQMRPPMPPMRQPIQPMRPPMEQMRPEMVRFPMRPPMDRPMMEQERQPFEQIIAYRQNEEPVRNSIEYQRPPQEIEQQRTMMVVPQQVHIRFEPQQPQQPQQQQDSDTSPNPLIQHIIQQIIAQKIMDIRKAQEQEQQQVQETRERNFEPPRMMNVPNVPERPVPHPMIPIPEEVLSHLNRLPNNERVIVAVSEPDSSEEDSSSSSDESSASQSASQETAPQQAQEQKPQDPEMVGREAYIRRLPVNIPVNMMQEQDQESQGSAAEETRPHYVQPRSVSVEAPKSRVTRSANPLVPEKRVKRCACECAC